MDMKADSDSVALADTCTAEDIPPISCMIAGDTAVPPGSVAGEVAVTRVVHKACAGSLW